MKIGICITARLKSSRLPLKLLKKIQGKPVIEHVIDRCKQVAYATDIVLCTSTHPQDKPLVDLAIKNGIYYYNGSQEDVLKRMFDAATFYNFDYILSITGENPLFSIHHANLMADRMLTRKYDFIYLDKLPIGTAVYGIRTQLLKLVCEVKNVIDTEIWGPLVNRPDLYSVHKIEAEGKYAFPELRVTMDYPEDFEFLAKVFESLPSPIPSLHEVLSFLRANPEVLQIHAHRKQLALSPEIAERIDAYYRDNQAFVLKRKQELGLV
jgi:spore coat polysaccharide biosynthesis protein SpsF